MAESYVYNPSEKISQSFKEAASSVGGIFSHIIQKKEEDYKIAENTFQNINALTEKLGQYGQQEITSSTKDLLANAAKTIQKNGKLDYDSLGAIRTGISDIKSRKMAIEGATEAYKQKVQIALATKDDLSSLSATLLDLEKPLLDTKNKSAQDIISQMDKAYENNIDVTKVATKYFAKAAPLTPFETDYTAKDGSKRRVKGNVIAGHTFNPATGVYTEDAPTQIVNPDGTIVKKDFYDKLADNMKATEPRTFQMLKDRLGASASFSSDKDIMKMYFDQTYKPLQKASGDIETKSKASIDTETYNADMAKFQMGIQGEKWALTKKQMESSIAANNAQRAAALAKINAQSNNGKIDPAQYGIVQDTNPKSKYYGAKSIDFGGNARVEITIPQQGGKVMTEFQKGMSSFQVQGIRTLPNGKKQLYGFDVKEGMQDAMGNKLFGSKTRYLDLDKGMQASLNMGIKNMPKDKQENLETGIYLYDSIEGIANSAQAGQAGQPDAVSEQDFSNMRPKGKRK
jgi:hypothetical protein